MCIPFQDKLLLKLWILSAESNDNLNIKKMKQTSKKCNDIKKPNNKEHLLMTQYVSNENCKDRIWRRYIDDLMLLCSGEHSIVNINYSFIVH